MTEPADPTVEIEAAPASELGARQLWETEERVAELEALQAEQLERERVLEVEIAALRRDVDVKVAYATALEEAAEERQSYVLWLQSHFDEERRRAAELSAELSAERARLSYRAVRLLVWILKPGRGAR
jgi:hypothetical protein